MPALPFKQVDVFTRTPLLGNPVAVVFDADDLDAPTMQRIAAWTNLSETTFVQRSRVATYRLRIFTPKRELPFAGHPTIGSAHAMREAGRIEGEATQECGAGIIPIRFEGDAARARAPRPKLRARIDASALRESLQDAPIVDPIAIDVGPVWLVARAPSLAALDAVRIAPSALAAYADSVDATGVTLYAVDDAVHVRSFAPSHGIVEDPVCGSGNVAVAAHLRASGLLGKTGEKYVAHQGKHCGRDGRVELCVEGDDVFLGGMSVTTIDGKIYM